MGSSVTFVSQEVSRPVTAGVTTVVSQQQPQTITQKFSNIETTQQIVSAAQPLQQQYNAQTRIVTQQITPSVYSANKISQNQFSQGQNNQNQYSQNQHNQIQFNNQNEYNQNQQYSQNQFNNQNDFQGRREISGYLETTSGDRFLGIFKSFMVPETATVSEESSDFQCSRYGQGYFADPASGCQKFHVCSTYSSSKD